MGGRTHCCLYGTWRTLSTVVSSEHVKCVNRWKFARESKNKPEARHKMIFFLVNRLKILFVATAFASGCLMLITSKPKAYCCYFETLKKGRNSYKKAKMHKKLTIWRTHTQFCITLHNVDRSLKAFSSVNGVCQFSSRMRSNNRAHLAIIVSLSRSELHHKAAALPQNTP